MPSTVTLQTTANPVIYGTPLTLTAIVSPAGATGTVTWYDGVGILGTTPLSAGRASLTTSQFVSGKRFIRARFSGDSTHQPSVSAVFTQTVSVLAQRGLGRPINIGTVHTPGPAAVGDFNGDGHADIAVLATLDGNVDIILGNGDGTFQAPVSYQTGTTPLSLAIGDFNGDGIPDLVVANRDSNNISVLIGNGSGTFKKAVNYMTGFDPSSVVIADFNNDGNADLAVANNGSNTISILFGNGDGTFLTPTNLSAPSGPLLMASGDFNGDGLADLAVPNRDANAVTIYLGQSDGTLKQAGQFLVGHQPDSVAVGDFNGDGFSDLAAVNYSDGTASILLGNGDATFRTPTSYSIGSSPDFIVVEDFNSDGIPDLAAANADSNPSVLIGKGDGTFQPATHPGSAHSPVPIAVADLNGDGRPDLVVPDFATDTVYVFLGVPITPVLGITTSHTGNFAEGQTGATYTITVSNVSTYSTWGPIVVNDSLPAGLTAVSIGGTGWTCAVSSATCTRSDALLYGTSYPPISLVVNVAKDAPASVVNIAMVSGGSAEPNSANDPTTITSNAITISTALILPAAQAGVGYSQTLLAVGGVPPYVWSLQAGSLPGGLNLSAAGIISGISNSAGTTTFSVQVKDSGSLSTTAAFSLTVTSQLPTLVTGGVLNAASFAKDSNGLGTAVAPGSLVTIYGTFPGASTASAAVTPYPAILGGVSVTFSGIPAPLVNVFADGSLPFVNAQVPFGVTGFASVIATVNGKSSNPISIPISNSAPGVFTIPPTGQGFGILVFVDPSDNIAKIAAPASAGASIGLPTAPIPRGQSGFFYVTGLGQKAPAVNDGDGGGAITHTAVNIPTVTIGGVPAQVQFAGQAPGFPGVDQINVIVPLAAPTGGAVIVVKSTDGTVVSNAGQIAIR